MNKNINCKETQILFHGWQSQTKPFFENRTHSWRHRLLWLCRPEAAHRWRAHSTNTFNLCCDV